MVIPAPFMCTRGWYDGWPVFRSRHDVTRSEGGCPDADGTLPVLWPDIGRKLPGRPMVIDRIAASLSAHKNALPG